jgi:hypothetical protein
MGSFPQGQAPAVAELRACAIIACVPSPKQFLEVSDRVALGWVGSALGQAVRRLGVSRGRRVRLGVEPASAQLVVVSEQELLIT